MLSSDCIRVVAAVAERDGCFLLCQRHDGPHLPLLWEFPGGKIEPGERAAGALRREIREELGTDCEVARELTAIRHVYPEKIVHIRFFRTRLLGNPEPLVHRTLAWVAPAHFSAYPAPPPNAEVLQRIQAGELDTH